MEPERTFDVVDTPPPVRRDWPSPKDFEEREELLKWRDIQLGIFKILGRYNHGQSKYGPSVVLKLEHQNGPIIHVWAPSSLVNEMEKRKSTNFILNLGVKISEETGRTYYAFKFC